jgi:hypothetical protein
MQIQRYIKFVCLVNTFAKSFPCCCLVYALDVSRIFFNDGWWWSMHCHGFFCSFQSFDITCSFTWSAFYVGRCESSLSLALYSILESFRSIDSLFTSIGRAFSFNGATVFHKKIKKFSLPLFSNSPIWCFTQLGSVRYRFGFLATTFDSGQRLCFCFSGTNVWRKLYIDITNALSAISLWHTRMSARWLYYINLAQSFSDESSQYLCIIYEYIVVLLYKRISCRHTITTTTKEMPSSTEGTIFHKTFVIFISVTNEKSNRKSISDNNTSQFWKAWGFSNVWSKEKRPV